MTSHTILALILHQAKAAAREAERAQRAAIRENISATRRAEQERRAAQIQNARMSEAESKRLKKETREDYFVAMSAEVEERNLKLEEVYQEIDSLLETTLDVDDFVDLETLRIDVKHPPFSQAILEAPIARPDPIPDPPQPVFEAPEPPKGLLAGIFGKQKHALAVAEAQKSYAQSILDWKMELGNLPSRRQAEIEAHAHAEAQRIAVLETAHAQYVEECASREAIAAERNMHLNNLITNLSYGTPEAVQEYISIILANSVYPEHFVVTHEFEFEPNLAELNLRVRIPSPDKIPTIKAYKYNKSMDEITVIPLSQKACRDRYANAVHQVALRSIHEVFESDRRGIIKTISLQVSTETVDPATGQQTNIPFIVVGAERNSFLEFKLSAVIPIQTLAHLGAAISKNPFDLVAVETSGIRRP